MREDGRPQRARLCCLLVTELLTCVRAAGQVPRNTLRQGFAWRAFIAEHSWNHCLGGREAGKWDPADASVATSCSLDHG